MQLGFGKKSMWNASWPVRSGRGGIKTCVRGMTAERPILAISCGPRKANLDHNPKFGDVLLLKIRALTKVALAIGPHSIDKQQRPPGEGRVLRRLLRTV